MALSNGLPPGRAAAPEWFFSVARISEEESGAKSYCSKSSDSNNPRRTPVVVPRCRNIIPLPISRSVLSAKYRLICSGTAFLMGWLFAQPGFRHHQLQRRRCGAYEIPHRIPVFFSGHCIGRRQLPQTLQIDPLFGNSRRGTAAQRRPIFPLQSSSFFRSAESVPRRQYPPAHPSRFALAFLSGRSSYRPMRPGCADSAYARC